MFDTICKFLAETFSSDFAIWLLETPAALTELSPSELSLEPIRADTLILRQSDDLVLHVEFQTEPKPDIPFRMADYRLRVYRRFPYKQMRQVVIYLRQTNSELVRQTSFILENTQHSFGVIRLWEQMPDVFLDYPGLYPFATLCQSDDRSQILRQVAQKIDQLADTRIQSNVTACTAVLAGLVLEKETIRQVLRRELMQESVIYQEIKAEGREEGREEGKANGERSLVLRQLTRRFGSVPESLKEQITKLSLDLLEALGEELLDFEAIADLENWLQDHQ